jgi:hypothetical protein
LFFIPLLHFVKLLIKSLYLDQMRGWRKERKRK